MSSVTFTSIDRATLPPLLMPVIKTHCRVEFSRDDVYLTGVASRSIDLFERVTGLSVFARLYGWTTTIAEGSAAGDAWRWPAPVVPFTGFTAMDGSTDVASEYQITSQSGDLLSPSWLSRAAGKPDTMPTLTAASGYKTLDALPPGILNEILLLSAWLYEYREAALMPGVDMLAYANSLLSSHWLPRA